mmetsp:Transcript_16850/g.53586  ORF Transcript_16850/g.53586 Transcript_16850/m.53586 type:complete len:232 (-) Transcript_16850:21-716(-)
MSCGSSTCSIARTFRGPRSKSRTSSTRCARISPTCERTHCASVASLCGSCASQVRVEFLLTGPVARTPTKTPFSPPSKRSRAWHLWTTSGSGLFSRGDSVRSTAMLTAIELLEPRPSTRSSSSARQTFAKSPIGGPSTVPRSKRSATSCSTCTTPVKMTATVMTVATAARSSPSRSTGLPRPRALGAHRASKTWAVATRSLASSPGSTVRAHSCNPRRTTQPFRASFACRI